MRVLGVDPGTQTTGYAVVGQFGERLVLLTCGVINAKRSLNHAQKLLHIYNGLMSILEEWQPAQVALEDFVFGNRQAAVAIGEARAVAILAASQAKLPVLLYKPAEIKQAVTGYGSASKDQVQQMIRLHLELDDIPASPDAADAVAIALGHLFRQNAKRLLEARARQ